MKIGEIWIEKNGGKEIVIDEIKYSSFVMIDEGDLEGMSGDEVNEFIKKNTKKDDVIYSHWVDTGEKLSPQLRQFFLKEFYRK